MFIVFLILIVRQGRKKITFYEIGKKANIFFLYIFLASGGGFPLYYTMILQRPRIIVGDSGFEPETSAPEVWGATNEPPENMHIKPNMTTCKINNCIYYSTVSVLLVHPV